MRAAGWRPGAIVLAVAAAIVIVVFAVPFRYAYVPAEAHVANVAQRDVPAFDLWGRTITGDGAGPGPSLLARSE
jgi:hypothetical protein